MVETPRPERTPPQNIEAEMCVLGSILLDNSALDLVLPIISTESFYKGAHRTVFDAVKALRDRNEAVDMVTLKEELQRRGKLEEVGGYDYLAALGESVPSAANAEYYARIVREKYMARRIIHAANDVLRMAYEKGEDSERLLAEAESRIFEIGQKGMAAEIQHISSFLNFELFELLQDSSKRVSGITTGFDDLDNLTSGLHPSELTIVAGRPSMGKTTFVNNILLHAGVQQKIPVAFFSLETSARQIGINLLSAHAKKDAHRLRRGLFGTEDWKHIYKVAGPLIDAPLFVDEAAGLTIQQLRAKARRICSREKVKLIAVDYLQQLEGSQRDNREQEISSISRSLKAMARELEIPVVVVSQLSRAVERREGNQPRLSDLRESGSIEQDADLVILLYRRGYYTSDSEGEDNQADVIVAKQRNGPTGALKLHFRRDILRFENYSSLEAP